ncbi:MAG: hypothetical protein ACLFOY_12660 [Desulfatibacillaceae bacterium]
MKSSSSERKMDKNIWAGIAFLALAALCVAAILWLEAMPGPDNAQAKGVNPMHEKTTTRTVPVPKIDTGHHDNLETAIFALG